MIYTGNFVPGGFFYPPVLVQEEPELIFPLCYFRVYYMIILQRKTKWIL